jgi:hypothetical protein
MSFIFSICNDGLGVRVADSLPRGQWFESPLEQFVLKTRAVNFILGNRNMIGKIPTWWENSDRGNRKTAGKNSAMVGNFPQWEKKSLPLHGSFSTAAPVLYAGNYLPLFSQCSLDQSSPAINHSENYDFLYALLYLLNVTMLKNIKTF